MQSEYARRYRELYERHWWWRSRERVILNVLREYTPATDGPEPMRILDVGCGDGLLFNALAPLGHVEGIEPDPETITATRAGDSRIHRGPLDETFAPEHPFDWVLLLDVLEHVDDPTEMLRHAVRALKSDGRLLITVPAFPCLWTTHDVLNEHRIRFTRRTLQPVVHGAGATLIRQRYFFHWLFPLKLVVRFAEWVARAKPHPPAIPTHIVNRACETVCRLEQICFGPWPLPFGSSLMAVAKRGDER